MLLFDALGGRLLGFALGQFGCLGQLIVLLLFVEVLILQVLGEDVGLCVGIN